jgi:hypothetical protein
LLTSPTPSRFVFNAQSPQNVNLVTVLVVCRKVQSVSKDGCLKKLIVHVGPAVVPFEYDVVEAGRRKVKHVLAAG